jgi:hypothetical protein
MKEGVMVYSGDYGDKIYGRLSYLRPRRDTPPNQNTPLFGLYAIRGWDLGTSRNGNAYDIDNTPRRFLTVFQGMRLPYYPGGRNREIGSNYYSPDRKRVVSFRFWGVDTNVYDSWIGEGFSPREVRAILGLTADDKTPEGRTAIRDTYVGANSGKPTVEAGGFYVP